MAVAVSVLESIGGEKEVLSAGCVRDCMQITTPSPPHPKKGVGNLILKALSLKCGFLF